MEAQIHVPKTKDLFMFCLAKAMPHPVLNPCTSPIWCTLFLKPLPGLEGILSAFLYVQEAFSPIKQVAYILEFIWSLNSTNKVKCAGQPAFCPVLERKPFLGPNVQVSLCKFYGLIMH